METMLEYFTLDRVMEILGLIVGLLYLYWEFHADAKLWFASIVMPLISFGVYYNAGLYADFAMNIYYLVIAVYGYAVWTRHRKVKNGGVKTERPITHISLHSLIGCVVAWIPINGVIVWWLINFTDSTVPWLDGFTTSLSIIATWMLARKYIEQWVAWIIVDAVCTGLYFYKDVPFYGVLYAAYTVVAVFGYFKWKRMMKA